MRRASVALPERSEETERTGIRVHKGPLKSPINTGPGRPQSLTKRQPRAPHKWHPAQQVVPNPAAGSTMLTWWVTRAKPKLDI